MLNVYNIICIYIIHNVHSVFKCTVIGFVLRMCLCNYSKIPFILNYIHFITSLLNPNVYIHVHVHVYTHCFPNYIHVYSMYMYIAMWLYSFISTAHVDGSSVYISHLAHYWHAQCLSWVKGHLV